MQTGRPPKHPRTPFGERLHCAREAAGLSQAQVSEKIGITQNAYATWERHSIAINPQQVEKLAEIFNISVEEFFSKPKIKKRKGGPTGKLRTIFEEASGLPRSQQSKIAEFVEGFLTLHRINNG